MEREQTSAKFQIGSPLPDFELPDVDGTRKGTAYLKQGKAALVLFSCNHCPYVKGSDEMLLSIVKRFQPEGLRVVAISSNDAVQYPEDSFEKMVEKSAQMSLPFPYLYDESQEIAKKFDAACTPEAYLFDRSHSLAFHGTINDNPRNPDQVRNDYLTKAIEQVLEGNKPDPAFVHPIGCSIKWKR